MEDQEKKIEDAAEDTAAVAQPDEKEPPAGKAKGRKTGNAAKGAGKPKIAVSLDPSALVSVKNGVENVVYRAKDGSLYKWGEVGAEHWLTVAELRYMLSAYPKFFSGGWLLVVDPEVADALQLDRFRGGVMSLAEQEAIFGLSAEEIQGKLEKAPPEQRQAVARAAKRKIAGGTLSDLAVIRAIEAAIGARLLDE